MGLIVGLLVGLALALGVALYVTKAPVPFVNKVPQRTAEQDAAEVERNKNWDPNAPLAGKPAAPTGVRAGGRRTAGDQRRRRPGHTGARPAGATAGRSRASRDPAAILAGRPQHRRQRPRPAKPGVDPFIYFVQAGAFGKAEDAEEQRAKLAMLGIAAKVTEREQAGRTVYRVRLGPYQMQGRGRCRAVQSSNRAASRPRWCACRTLNACLCRGTDSTLDRASRQGHTT